MFELELKTMFPMKDIITENEKIVYNKNMELWIHSLKNSKYITKIMYDLGVNDQYILFDYKRFVNTYPYFNISIH